MKVAAKMMDLKSSKPDVVQLLLSEFFQEVLHSSFSRYFLSYLHMLFDIFEQVAVVSKLQHPNICRFLGAAIEPPKYCVVFEYMEGGDLFHYLRYSNIYMFISEVTYSLCLKLAGQKRE